MILVGQYDSPFVRRVGISLGVLGFAYEHDTRSVFGDFDSMRQTNPLARIPSLVLDDGAVLIDSVAILDWLDETVGATRALLPRSGLARRQALQRVALAIGAVDKAGASAYERIIRPAAYRWPDWIQRCRTQAQGAVAALAALDWPEGAPLDQAQITTACMLRYLEMTDSELRARGRYPALDALSARLEARPEFQATYPPDIAYPAGN
ncbi:MAG TPA: glutathione S-transferase N-terminal domain-containing protein [Devosia sp.]|nr:glutathione S-transferase N-terminal domain-containing protein [Devosia sp.]